MDSSNSTERMNRALTGTTSRRRALKLFGGGLAGVALAGAGFSLQGATAQTSQNLIPIEGLLGGDTFEGALQVGNFFVENNQLLANVNLLNEFGDIVGEFVATVTPQQQACDILLLELGPINLELLGLVINVPNPIILEITAEPGPGNLLGNLLCTVAGLLDRGGPLQGIARLLNRILSVLG